MKKTPTLILTLLFALFMQFTFAQEKTVTGTVADENGIPLPGVNVVIKSTTNGTQTDFDGRYSLTANQGDVLVFSFLGMETVERTVGAGSTLDVVLEEGTAGLDEVLVVAYGTVKKGAFTGSAGQIDAAEIAERPISNITQALQGEIAGVNVSASSGQPGAGPDITIRGIGSFSASNSPLIILDGVQYDGSLSSINTNDVESVTVLKDAASTSLYGSRAANGVLMITTKTGRKDREIFSLSVSQGITSRALPEYDRVSPEQYYELMWEARRNALAISGSTPMDEANQTATNTVFDNLGYNPFNVPNDQIVLTDGRINPAAELLYPEDLDWQAPLMRTGSRTNTDFSYQGGSERTDYFVSLGYLEEQGYIINSDFQRVTGRINVNSKFKEWFKTGLNLSGSTSTGNQSQSTGSTSLVNPFFTTRRIAPIYPVFLHDPQTGEYILDEQGNRIYDEGGDRVGSTSGRHVIQETILNEDIDKISALSARTYAEFYFLNDFTFTVNAALDKRFFHNSFFQNPIIGDAAGTGRASRSGNFRTTINYNQLLNYNKVFGKHSFSALLGHESYETEIENLTGTRQEQIVDGNTELINFTTTTNLSSYMRRQTREGYFSRLNYDFDNKYFLSGSYRRDASSRFSKDARWGDFFSVGAAWRLDRENFIQDVEWINALKLRASYGEVGNDELGGFYASQSLFSLGFNNQNEGGILVDAPGNRDLKWETNIQKDIALEFGLFNNRINGTIEYYQRESKDLLFDVPLPVSSGLDDFPDNVGDWVNEGYELELRVGIIRSADFQWDINLNAATLKNEITRLPQEEIINGSKKLVVGGDIYAYWLRDFYGVDPADGAALYIVDPELVGDGADVRTVDGVEVTTNHNKALYDFVGTANPDVFGGITNNFTYGGFNLGFTFTYQLGGKTYDTNYAGIDHAGQYGTALSTEMLNRWQNPGDITNIPRMDANRINEFGAASDRFLVSSDYIALRQANVGYTFNERITDDLGLNTFRLYVSGENLWLKTAREGMDVGQNFNGTVSNRYTPSRVISIGANLTF